MRIKYLLFLAIIGVIIFICFNIDNKNCIFLNDTNINVILDGGDIFTLTSRGLRYQGTLEFFKRHEINDSVIKRFNGIKTPDKQVLFLNVDYNNKVLYLSIFDNMLPAEIYKTIRRSIFRMDLKDQSSLPEKILEVDNMLYDQMFSISPNYSFLLFKAKIDLFDLSSYGDQQLKLLDLKNNRNSALTSDVGWGALGEDDVTVWISDYQFLYTNINAELVLYDISTFLSENLGLHGYYLGGKIDNENLLLSDYKGIYKYNLNSKELEKIIKVDRNVMGGEYLILWIPSLNGFIYTERTWYDIFHQLEVHRPDLFFYSMDKKRKVLLMREYPINNGFILPENIYDLLEERGVINPKFYVDYKKFPKHIETICHK